MYKLQFSKDGVNLDDYKIWFQEYIHNTIK